MPRGRDLPRGERTLQLQGPRGSGAGRISEARGSGAAGVPRMRAFGVQTSSSWGLRALAGSLGQLAQVGEQVMNDQFRQRAKAVEREQSLAGAEYGLGVELDQLQLPAGDSIGDEAFRRSAILAARAKVGTAAYTDVEELAKLHPGKPEDFRKALQERATKFVTGLPQDLRPEAAETYARVGQQRYLQLDDQRREFERDQNRASILEATELHGVAATRAARMGDWGAAAEELAKLGELTAAAGPVELGGSGALSLVEIEKQSQAVNDAARESFIQGWVDRSSDPMAVINGIRTGKTGNPILDDILAQTDPGKLDPLVNSMEVEVRRQQAAARMEARQAASLARAEQRQAEAIAKAEARAQLAMTKAAVGEAAGVLLQGKEPPNLSEVAQMASAYPDLAMKLDSALRRKEGAAQFATLPAQERIDTLNELAAIETMTADDLEYVDALRKRHESIVGAKDKYSAAVEAGLVEPTPLDLSDPTSLEARMQAADTIEEVWPDVRVSGLRQDEVESLTAAMEEMTPEEQAATLGRLSGQMPPERFERVLPQIAEKEPAVAMAASVAQKRPQVGADILRGRQLLKDGTVQKVDPSTYAVAADDKLGVALKNSPSATAAAREAAQALEAARRFNAGKTDKDSFDEDAYREAIDEVTGGVLEFNGEPVIAPEPGMDEDAFADILGLVDGDDLSIKDANGISMPPYMPGGGPLTPEAFKKYATLESVGEGRYLVKVGGGYALDPTTNEPFVFDWQGMTAGARRRAAEGARSRREGLLGVPVDDDLSGGSGLDRLAPGVRGTMTVPVTPQPGSVAELMRRLLGVSLARQSVPIPAGADAAVAAALGLRQEPRRTAEGG